MSADKYRRFEKLILTENQLRSLDFPRPKPSGNAGDVLLYGDHFGFKEGRCKRCDKTFDVTFTNKESCNFHLETSRIYRRRQQPHGCCNKPFGSNGCRIAPSHVYRGNLYLDLSGYRRTAERLPEPADGDHGVYALDTESVHTKKGTEVCKVTVINTNMDVVYDQYCQPTTEIIDYNTIWSGVKETDLAGITKTYDKVRNDLLKLFSDKTIMIGHGVHHDLIALKFIHSNMAGTWTNATIDELLGYYEEEEVMWTDTHKDYDKKDILHDKVVDTLILYPHNRGLPYRRSLKEIVQTVLHRSIQTGEGHSSKEDAEFAMKLALRKV